MTLEELKSLLRNTRYRNFNVVVNPVGPSDEWTEAEQIEDCCALVPNPDPCVGDGKKVEPWDGWTDDEKQRLGFTPSGVSAQELLSRAEAFAGAGNVHLKIRKVGSVPCGEKVTNFVGSLDCCTEPDELLKGSGDTTVSPGDEVAYSVVSGSGSENITWDTIGFGVNVVKDGEWSARGNVDDCFCTPVVVYATDSCESVAPWIVSADDGSWSTIDDESLSSPFGWFQDGTAGSFYVMGFNDDNTKVSTQHYWEAEYSGTVEQVCGTTMPGINNGPIATPQLSQGFYKCSEENIWVRLKEGYTNVWAVRYAIDNQNTIEYTEGDCVEELLYDNVNSGEIISDSSSVEVFWSGGIAPYRVSVSGQEVFVDSSLSSTQKTTASTHSSIYSGNTCGPITVTIQDSCGISIEGAIRATDGQWVLQGSARAYGPTMVAGWPELFGWKTSGLTQWQWKEIEEIVGDKCICCHQSGPGIVTGYWKRGPSRLFSCEEIEEWQELDPYFDTFPYLAVHGGTFNSGSGACYLSSSFPRNYWRLDYQMAAVTNSEVFFHQWEC